MGLQQPLILLGVLHLHAMLSNAWDPCEILHHDVLESEGVFEPFPQANQLALNRIG